METTKPNPQSVPAQPFAPRPAPANMAPPVVLQDDLPPWIEDNAPFAVAPFSTAPVRMQPCRALAAARPAAEFEAVHWTVVALTLFTAISVLLGAFGGHTRPRELLPVMITTAG